VGTRDRASTTRTPHAGFSTSERRTPTQPATRREPTLPHDETQAQRPSAKPARLAVANTTGLHNQYDPPSAQSSTINVGSPEFAATPEDVDFGRGLTTYPTSAARSPRRSSQVGTTGLTARPRSIVDAELVSGTTLPDPFIDGKVWRSSSASGVALNAARDCRSRSRTERSSPVGSTSSCFAERSRRSWLLACAVTLADGASPGDGRASVPGALREINVDAIEAFVHHANHPSRRILDACGSPWSVTSSRVDGSAKSYCLPPDG